MKTAEERWEDGDEHDPRSVVLGKKLRNIDEKYCEGSLDLSFGGDGDNGENLLYVLDIYFELEDKKK